VIKDLVNDNIFEKIYYAVVICVGKYSNPIFPNIEGIDTFNGNIIHSHDYRIPNYYLNKNVLVLGGGHSGTDISIEVSQYANMVLFCHLNKPYMNFPKNIKQEMATIKRISNSEIELTNGKIYDNINAIIFGTGYRLNFDFLDINCGISLKNDATVDGLYLHLINTTYPSMAIIGILHRILPFPLFHQQVL
jgi:cation diffusion facilitator CzcD-associated flavoprotein CzcO